MAKPAQSQQAQESRQAQPGVDSQPRIEKGDAFHRISFFAMASPCELLVENIDGDADTLADKQLEALSHAAYAETKRIEHRFSRYRDDNLCYAINHAQGRKIEIDDECYRLLAFANECYLASEGLFDLTSGILRKAWHFDGQSGIPPQNQINELLDHIGWPKVKFDEKYLQMPAGMELDFGGIGKEYAVDRVAHICAGLHSQASILINFGGDIQITRPRHDRQNWSIGIENPQAHDQAHRVLNIVSGALATSGDARRFVTHQGKRYGHILNPKTGWPVPDAPRSVTVAARHCAEAGCLATIALLQGRDAEAFLKAQNVQYWCIWS